MNSYTLHYVSLGLTPLVYFALAVVITHYAEAAWHHRKPTAPAHWLVLGIVISMLFKLPDNSFWNASWSAFLFGKPERYFEMGPPINIVFRQLPVIVACACHWFAEYKTTGRLKTKTLIWSAVFAACWFALMTWIGSTIGDSPE